MHKLEETRNKKVHISYIFIMSLVVICFILLFAGIVVASAEEIPDFYDDFSDGKIIGRTGTDPWGRPLPEWSGDLDASQGFVASSGWMSIPSDIVYGTWKFKYRFPNAIAEGWPAAGISFWPIKAGTASFGWTEDCDTHHHCTIFHDGESFSIDYDGAGVNEDGEWHDVTIIRTTDGWYYIYKDGILDLYAYDPATINSSSMELLMRPETTSYLDNIEVYKDKYLFPEKEPVFAEYIANYQGKGDYWLWPIKREGIVVFNRNTKLSDIANAINNPTLFTYDPITKTAICYTDLVIFDGAELIIEDETLKFHCNYDGELYFAPKYGSMLRIKNSTITTTKEHYFVWNNAGATTHLAHSLIIYSKFGDYYESKPGLGHTFFNPAGTRFRPCSIEWSSYARFIIEDSVIDNTAHMFFDSPYQLNMTNTQLTNLHEIDIGNYTPTNHASTDISRAFTKGDKSFWVYTDDLNVYDFVLQDVTISGAGGAPLNINLLINAHRDKLNIYDINAEHENIIINNPLCMNEGQSHTCYSPPGEIRPPYGWKSYIDTEIGLVNCKFKDLTLTPDVFTDCDGNPVKKSALVKYYLDVKVVDGSGTPVSGAMVTVANEVDSSYPAENMEVTKPYATGAYSCFYHHYRIVDGQPLSSTITDADGHTSLPSDKANTFVIADYVKDQTSQTNFVYTITSSKNGQAASISGLDIDESWYRENPNVPTKTVICNLGTGTCSIEGGVPDTSPPTIVSYSPSGTDVAVYTNISVSFSEPMNKSSAQNAFSISPNVSGSFSWAGNQMIFNPSSNLSYETTYTITISTTAQDLAGNNLQSPYTWQFTTVAESAPDTTPPAAVANLATSSPTANSITLTWTAPGDDGNTGTASYYDIRYSTSQITSSNWGSTTRVSGEPSPLSPGTSQSMIVTGLSSNTTYYFAIKTADEVPNWSDISNSQTGTTLSTSQIIYVATDGTGNYNCDGIDDQVEINEAIDYVAAHADFTTVHLKAGIYTIDGGPYSIILKGNNKILEGDGPENTIIKLKNGNNYEPRIYLLYGQSLDNYIIRNIKIDGNKANNPAHTDGRDGSEGIHIEDPTNCKVYNITVANVSEDGLFFYQTADHCEVHDSSFFNIGHDAIRFWYGRDHLVRNCYTRGMGDKSIRLYKTIGCVIEYCDLRSGDDNIGIYTEGSDTADNTTIRHCIIGPDTPESNMNCQGITIFARGSSTINGTKIINNIIFGHGAPGYEGNIWLNARDVGCLISDTLIENNVIYDSWVGSGIEVGPRVTNTVVRNNIIVNNAEYGIDGNVISTYNDVWNNANGNYGGGASAGTGDIFVNPLFANPENKDFHLKSTVGRWDAENKKWVTDGEHSPCIDAGDSDDDYSNEPDYPDGHINMGAYGNTEYASLGSAVEDTTPPYTSGHNPAKNATGVAKDTNIEVHIKDDGSGVDQSSIVMAVEGNQVTPTITGTPADYTLTYNPSADFDHDQVVDITIDASDLATPPNVMPQDSYSFTIESAPDATLPAKVTDLATSSPTSNSITLTWTAPGDDGNTGTASQYDIRYSTSEIVTEADWNSATQCNGEPTPQVAGTIETFTITGLAQNTSYYFALKTADEVPNWAKISNCAIGTTSEITCQYVWIEAENANSLTPDFEIASDTSASNGKYIQIPEGIGFHAHDGEANYTISINSLDNYVIWGRKIVATDNDNSFFIQIEDGTRYLWTLPLSDNWQWDAVNHWGSGGEFDPEIDPVIFTLSAGEHTLRILQREDGAKLDKLLITNDMSYVPPDIEDTTPPAGISNLQNNTGTTWINWTWTNPLDIDFNHTKVYLDGIWQTNISNMYFNATKLTPDTSYGIGTRTVDTTGNVNSTWTNQTAKTLIVPNSPPVADQNGPYTGTESVPILFNGSGSYDPDGSIVAYEWDFGDGNTSSEVSPTHTYTQNGTYTVTLTVTDNGGATDTNTTTATIADTEPTAGFTATPTSGFEPLTVAFTDNSTSYDGITAWEWDFESDEVIDNTTQNPIYTYTEAGTYTVTLKVYEADGSSDTETKEDYITATKVNNAPYKPHNPSPSDGAITISVNTDLSWSGGDPDADDTVTYDVYFGTDTTPPLFSEDQSVTTYDLGTLNYSTLYYWWIVATDNHGASNESEVWNFTTTAASDSPPLVTNPAATPATILNDPGRPRAPGTNISQLNVTVTDDTEVDTVTIDLSLIGGSAEAQMTKIPGTDIWTVTVKAMAGINLTHNLVVNATDISGNFNNTVSITLTVLRRSDVFRDNIVDMKDAVYIARYLAGLEPERSNPPSVLVGDIVGLGGDPTGDGIVNMKDAVYIARYKAGWEDEP